MPCNHKFQGHKNGVTCLLCGMEMNPKDYAFFLEKSKTDAKRDAERIAKLTASEPKPETPINPPVSAVPKRTRKKKEATADE